MNDSMENKEFYWLDGYRDEPQEMIQWFKDNLSDYVEDIVDHGVDAGFLYLTYYRDTGAIYGHFRVAIWKILEEEALSMGYDNMLEMIAGFGGAAYVSSPFTFENLMVWAVAEIISRRIMDEKEMEI